MMNESELNELKAKIQEILNDGQGKLSEISAIEVNSKQKETELNTYHSRIIELKTTIESNSTSLTDIYNGAVEIKKQIDELHVQAKGAKEAIDGFHQESNTRTNEINDFYNNFQELKQKVENPDEGISETLNKSKELFDQIAKTNLEVTISKEDILKNKIQSEGFLKETTDLKGGLVKNLAESERLKTEIGKILDLVRDTGLANSFDRRRKRSQRASLIAIGVILSGVLISLFSIYNIFLTTQGQALFSSISSDYIKFLLRLTLTAPGVFTAWFGAIQYSKERYFLEQYEFKTAAALALENYTKLLKDNYPDQKKEIFGLSLELIKSVYKEPTYIKPKSGLFVKNRILEKQAGEEKS